MRFIAITLQITLMVWMASLVSAQDSDYLFSLPDLEVGGSDSFETTVFFDNTDGEAIQGYSFGVCHNEDDFTLDSAEMGSTAEETEYTFHAITELDEGVTVGGLLDIITQATLGPGSGFELLDMEYTVLAEDGSSDLEFCETLGVPAVPNEVNVGGQTVEPETSNGTITFDVTAETFIFSLPATLIVGYPAASGEATFEVSASIEEHADSPGRPNDAYGFSMGIAHDSQYLQVDEIVPTTLFDDMNAGAGADFFAGNILDDGFTLGVVFSLDDTTVVESFEDPEEVAVITYSTVSDDLADAEEPTTTELDWDDNLDNPPIQNTVVFSSDGDTSSVQRVNCLVTLEPGGTRFKRGDCNGNGTYDIGDPIHLLGALFLGTGPATCEDACDFDDNGSMTLVDAINILTNLFQNGENPEDPYPDCGADPTETDDLGCEESTGCA